MENIILTVHLILAVILIGVVLLQRSEGGGLGASNTSGSGVMTGRQAANALTKVTWGLAALFLITSITLTVIASRGQVSGSILDRLGATVQSTDDKGTAPASSAPGVELPPPASSDAPATPPAADAPATPPVSK